MTQAPYDPFATNSTPAVSFKDKPIGTSYTGKVLELPALVHSRDFESGEMDYWPDGNKKMSVVTLLEVDGEHRGLWAPKPSAMFAAIADAQKAAGATIAVGGSITVSYIGDEPNKKNPRLNPAKQYRVSYKAPDAFGDQSSTDSKPPF